MVSKVFFLALAAVLALEASGDPRLCSLPELAKEVLYRDTIHVDAPLFGRVQKDLLIPTIGKTPSCLLINGLSGSSLTASTSIVSVGISDVALNVTLVSGIKSSIDGVVTVYGY